MARGTIYRLCEAGDAPQLRQLWKLVFGDTDSFLDFYFSKRFVPEYSVCTEVDGVIVGAIFGLPCSLSVRGVAVKASMSSGFCTHPDHRGKGYFTNLYKLYLHVLRKNAVVLAPNTPVYHDAYFRLETRSATRSRYLSGTCPTYLSLRCQLVDGEENLGKLQACYDRNMSHFSGQIVRSFADFRLRIQDSQSDGGKILGIFEENSLLGYAIYFLNTDKLLAIELLADSPDVAEELLYGLANQAKGRSMEVKMAPDSVAIIPGLAAKIRSEGVCALVNIGELLRLVGKDLPISLEVFDGVVPENNGIFNFSGEQIATLPAGRISSGHLLQGLLGYLDFEELKNAGDLQVYDHHKTPVLNRHFAKTDCFIWEAY